MSRPLRHMRHVKREHEQALRVLRAFGEAIATIAHVRLLSLAASGGNLRASSANGTFCCEYTRGLGHQITAYRATPDTLAQWTFEDTRGPEYTAAAAVAKFIEEATR